MFDVLHHYGAKGREPLRLGLVGCGRLAAVGYAPAVEGLAEAEIVAVADPDAGRGEALGRRLGASVHASAEALVTDARIDALLIASPADAHRAHAELSCAAGLPCLIEKPPAADLEGAEALAELEPMPWIGFNRRFQHARALLDRFDPGPLHLDLELRYRRASWRPHTVNDEALLDLAPHLVDLAFLLSGRSDAELRSARVQPYRVDLELALGPSTATIRCATDRAYSERVALETPDGETVAVSRAGGPVRGLITRLPWIEHPLVGSLRAQLESFAAAIRGEGPRLLANAGDGVRVMRVIDAAAGAAVTGEPAAIH